MSYPMKTVIRRRYRSVGLSPIGKIVQIIISLLCLCSGHVFQSSCKNEPCCCNALVIVRHVHMEGSNLDLAHKTNEIHKIFNISLTMQLSSPGA